MSRRVWGGKIKGYSQHFKHRTIICWVSVMESLRPCGRFAVFFSFKRFVFLDTHSCMNFAFVFISSTVISSPLQFLFFSFLRGVMIDACWSAYAPLFFPFPTLYCLPDRLWLAFLQCRLYTLLFQQNKQEQTGLAFSVLVPISQSIYNHSLHRRRILNALMIKWASEKGK